MKQHSTKALSAILLVCSLTAIFGTSSPKTHALPIYARRYGVTCDTCHTVAPRLNEFGQAFAANRFNWPAGTPPKYRIGIDSLPISGLATYSSTRDNTFNATTDQFDSLKLFASNGFTTNHGAQGGYFIDYFTGTGNALWGQLGNAFVTVPIVGNRGQTALTIGQFTPMYYQYNPDNSLSNALPAALSTGADAFALTSPLPGVRLDYFDHAGERTGDGDYLSIGVPFTGELQFNNQSQVDGPSGYYLGAFRRQSTSSYGAYAYQHDGKHTETVVGTLDSCPVLGFLAAASEGHDATGSSTEYSLEADYTPFEDLGLTARLESVASDFQSSTTYPVLDVTYYPGRQKIIRLLGETIQDPHDRTTSLFILGQF